MKRILFVLLITILVAGCVNGKFKRKTIVGGPCGDVDGYTYTLVAYGNGSITIIPLSRIRANTEWRFYLYPVPKLGGAAAYGDSDVTVAGKPVGTNVLTTSSTSLTSYALPIPTPATGDTWLSASGDFNNDATGTGRKRFITACVDPDVKVDQEWQYMVTIDDVGEIDPRARVE